ncbi:MAG: sigma-70 family RNA polymerase sigma factor, partial [Bacteroidota bacterium]
WMYRVALNTAISFYRKTKTYQQKTTALTTVLETTLESKENVQEDSRLSALKRLIQELKEIDKALILMYLEGLSQKEIATIIGLSPSNVGTKISRIKKQLRQRFQNLKE